MEQYKDFWISGHATPGYPAGLNLTPGATVLYQRPNNSVVELTNLDVMPLSIKSFSPSARSVFRQVNHSFGSLMYRLASRRE